eukprot:5110240-Pyramimonas_sp.AAC.1
MLCRVWSLCREPCARDWSASLTSDWDAAIAGNNAFREAYLKVLESEVAVKLGATVGRAILDIKSFYDHIQWPRLIRAALRLGYPPALLFLELQSCLPPRLASRIGAHSIAFQPTRSVVQGLRSGTRFA